ncbi:MAG TPA: DNA (cytosine-5-)-methyltransferase, partial [Phycisphaerae bacterium]|nr:DNA (cytosine-5-)-methyltransferase [Phycisphaerae bacterium]
MHRSEWAILLAMPKQYKVISLFSGGMGLDLGLESTGRFRIVACVEKVPAFCDTIRLNQKAGLLHPNLKVFEQSIMDVSPEEVLDAVGLKAGEVDLIVGGPPCQSFSTAGCRGTVQDARGTLLWQFLRFVGAIKPRFFLMENVRGLLSAAIRHRKIAERPKGKAGEPLAPDEEPGSVVRQFASDLQAIGDARYHMDCFEVNAVNYGAPQIRERALFIGNRYNMMVNFPDPTHGSEAASASRTLFEDKPTPL